MLVRGASFHANKQEASCSDPAIEQSTEELKTIGREKEGFSALSGGTTVVFLALGGQLHCITVALYDHTDFHMATPLTLSQPFRMTLRWK